MKYNDVIKDEDFGIKSNSLCLIRHVEVFKHVEVEKEDSNG